MLLLIQIQPLFIIRFRVRQSNKLYNAQYSYAIGGGGNASITAGALPAGVTVCTMLVLEFYNQWKSHCGRNFVIR
jgi:hypothetical protein